MSSRADPGVQAARDVLAGADDPSGSAVPLAIPAAELRRILDDVLNCVEEAGQLLGHLDDPGVYHDRDERRRLKAQLLQVLPVKPQPGDVDDSFADLLTVIPGDMCLTVTRWLSAARSNGAAEAATDEAQT